jgi:hypothetical protein
LRRSRPIPRPPEQARLADARLTFDQHGTAGAGDRPVDDAPEHGKLGLAVDQQTHAPILPRRLT